MDFTQAEPVAALGRDGAILYLVIRALIDTLAKKGKQPASESNSNAVKELLLQQNIQKLTETGIQQTNILQELRDVTQNGFDRVEGKMDTVKDAVQRLEGKVDALKG